MRGGLINQVYRLVGEKPVADVTLGEGRSGDNGLILYLDAVMQLVTFLEAPQDGDGIFHRWLSDEDGLKTTLQGWIFFNILAIFVQGGRAYAAELPPRQRGFQHVRGVHGALRRTGSHDRMDFVYEEDYFPLRGRYFLEDRLQTFLEFAPVFGAGHEGADIETDHRLSFEAFRHIAIDDALRQSFHDGRLADTGFADQHGIVLGAAGKHLHNPSYFLIPANHGVEGPLPGQFVKVSGVPFQRLVFFLGVRIGNALVAADFHKDLKNLILRHTGVTKDSSGCAVLFFRNGY